MKNTLENIINAFPITNDEYKSLEKSFINLAHYASWQLKKRNSKILFINDQEDDVQNLRISLLRAGAYYKRQTYIELCFDALGNWVKDDFVKCIVEELKELWKDRKKHGANRQKFGPYQEEILEKLVNRFVPENSRPSKKINLVIDDKFERYCKQILWNEQRFLGKQISREKAIREHQVSLSEHEFLS